MRKITERLTTGKTPKLRCSEHLRKLLLKRQRERQRERRKSRDEKKES
jgi:hypothetical protein